MTMTKRLIAPLLAMIALTGSGNAPAEQRQGRAEWLGHILHAERYSRTLAHCSIAY